MRLWHKDLIPYLPDKMLLSQWRELSAIVGSINIKKTPNHRLVNILLDYPKSHFYTYTNLVYNEMKKRGFKINKLVLEKIYAYTGYDLKEEKFDSLYKKWHNNRYLKQCIFNLEEKYDRGIITNKEWKKIKNSKNN